MSSLPVHRRYWAPASVALLVVRLPVLFYPRMFDDEQVYTVVAREVLQGGRPYLDEVERKPPLLFGVYTTIHQLTGGHDWLAILLVTIIWNVTHTAIISR